MTKQNPMRLKIALAQLNPIADDLVGNAGKAADAHAKAAEPKTPIA